MDEVEPAILEFRRTLKRLKAAIECAHELEETEIKVLDRRVVDLFNRIVQKELTEFNALLKRIVFLTDYLADSCDNDSHVKNLCRLIQKDGERMEKMVKIGAT